MNNSNKNNGFTFVELLIYTFIFSILSFSVLNNYSKSKLKYELLSEQRKIVLFIRKIVNYQKLENSGDYFFYVNLIDRSMSLNLKEYNGNREIYKVDLSKKFDFISNNKDKNKSFERDFTDSGNFSKGFTIYIIYKDIVYYKISVNTVNSLRYPLITVYKTIKELNVNDNLNDLSIWKEDII